MSELPSEISCRDLQQRLLNGDRLLLVDCREQQEHALGTIPGATLLPMSQLAQRQNELAGQESRPIVVYCHLGIRSQRVAAWLREQGFSEVQSLAGGIDAWAEQIDPQMTRY